MRHIPPQSWFVDRLDRFARETIDLLYQTAFGTSHENRDLEHDIEHDLQDVIRLLRDFSRLAGGKPGAEGARQHLRVELEEAVGSAKKSLEAIDSQEFGKPGSWQSFERSQWESLLATWLVIEDRLLSILDRVEKLDPEVRLRWNERLAPPSPALDAYSLAEWKQA